MSSPASPSDGLSWHRWMAGGIASLEVRREICDAYNARVDAAHEQMISTHPGMTTCDRNAAGRVVTTTPWRLIDYWALTRTPDLAEFHVTPGRFS